VFVIRKKLSIFAGVMLAAFMLTAITAFAAVSEAQGINLVVNGRAESFNATVITIDGRTLAPVRELFYKLGGDESGINWNEGDRTATLTLNGTTVTLTADSATATINGENVSLDVAPVLHNDLTYMPIRFVAESFGYVVGWNAGSRTIGVSTQEHLDRVLGYVALVEPPETFEGFDTRVIVEVFDIDMEVEGIAINISLRDFDASLRMNMDGSMSGSVRGVVSTNMLGTQEEETIDETFDISAAEMTEALGGMSFDELIELALGFEQLFDLGDSFFATAIVEFNGDEVTMTYATPIPEDFDDIFAMMGLQPDELTGLEDVSIRYNWFTPIMGTYVINTVTGEYSSLISADFEMIMTMMGETVRARCSFVVSIPYIRYF